MARLLPAIAGALAIGAATIMKRSQSQVKKAARKGSHAAKAARAKVTRKRAARKR